MTSAYEKPYGAVVFEHEDGTPIFDTEDDLGLWLVEDREPSPEPKWVRVSVPGADGSVDLSRALTGQVQYERREITLRFDGQEADHAAALALIHTMRAALHGARVRVTTMLTAQIGGWYLADCECDGTADAGGGVSVTVSATADPFIRVGTQTLALPYGSESSAGPSNTLAPGDDLLAGAGRITATWTNNANTYSLPGVTSGRLWWAESWNMFDASMWPMRSAEATFADPYTWKQTTGTWRSGQAVGTGPLVGTKMKRLALVPTPRTDYVSYDEPYPRFRDPGFPFFARRTGDTSAYVGVFATGKVDSVDTPPAGFVAGVSVKIVKASTFGPLGPNGSEAERRWVPTAGTQYDGQLIAALDVTVSTPQANAVVIEAEWITSSGGLTFNVCLFEGSTPASWEEARVGWAAVEFGGTFLAASNLTDEVAITPAGVTTTHRLDLVPGTAKAVAAGAEYETAGTVSGWPPAGATAVTLTATDDHGDNVSSTLVETTEWEVQTASGTNLAMRSTPSVTSAQGALVTMGGRTAIAGPGTVALDALTVPGGAFTVEYATLGGTTDAALTWEGGAL